MTRATKTSQAKTSEQPTTDDGIERMLTVGDVVHRLAVDEATVRRWIKDGHLRAYKLPGGYRVQPADLAHFLGDRVARP